VCANRPIQSLTCPYRFLRFDPHYSYTCLADAGFFMDYPNSPQSPKFEESFYAWNSSAGTNQV
jgi:hypothetical protein